MVRKTRLSACVSQSVARSVQIVDVNVAVPVQVSRWAVLRNARRGVQPDIVEHHYAVGIDGIAIAHAIVATYTKTYGEAGYRVQIYRSFGAPRWR